MLKQVRFGIQPRILIMLLFLSLAPLLAGIWIFFSHSEKVLLEAKGQELADLAEITVLQVRNHLKATAALADTLTFNPAVVQAMKSANDVNPGQAGKARTDALALEKIWKQLPAEDPRVQKVVTGELAGYLKKILTIHPLFREISVLDRQGILLAATSVPDRFLAGDEQLAEKVRLHYLNHGAYYSDIKFNPLFNSMTHEIMVPVLDTEDPGHPPLGLVRCTINPASLNGLIRPILLGRTGQALIISSDGTIISSRTQDVLNQITYDHFQEVLPFLKATGKSYQVLRTGGNPVRIIGLPETLLSSQYPELNWFVLIQQDYDEATASIEGLREMSLLFMAITVLITLLLAFWFTRLLTKPIIELDMHLEKL